MGGSAEKEGSVAWYRRQDIWMFTAGMIFIAILVGGMFGLGALRGWYAPSGYEHDTSPTSPARFLPEPYENDTYSVYRGRHGASVADLRGRWYYWQLRPWEVTALTRLFVWFCYVGHQLSIWLVIYLAQVDKAESGGPKYSSQVTRYNWICFGLNVFFHLMHLLQTHTTYDALAQDVVITSSQGSVIMLLVLVMLMQYTDRGLFFGWPTLRHTGKASVKLRLNAKPIHLVRKYHGYAFAWAAVYTFWYHPMENTYGHALGFVYTWGFMLQGSMMYTNLHLNRWWRLIQEFWVCIHGGLVAVQTGGPALSGTSLWPMFVFGFLWLLALSQIFLLDFWNKIPGWVRIFPTVICLAITLTSYAFIPDQNGQTWVRLQEIIRIPAIYYLCVLFAWALVYFFLWVDRKIKGEDRKPQPVTKVKQGLYITGFLLTYSVLVGISAFFQLGGVNIMMFLSMVLLIFVFIAGACVSFMLVDQIVPRRTVGNSSSSSATGSDHSMKKTAPVDAVEVEAPEDKEIHDNPALTSDDYSVKSPRDSPRGEMVQVA